MGRRLLLLPLILTLAAGLRPASAADTSAAPPADTSAAPLASVLAAAGERGVPAVVRVHAAWCAPCVQLDAEVFEDADSAELLAGVAIAAVDFDTDAGQVVTGRHRVLELPTVLVLAPDGRELGRVEGYDGRAAFLRALGRVLRGDTAGADALRARATANVDDGASWLDLGRHVLLRGDPVEAEAVLRRAIDADPSGALGVAGAAYGALARYHVRVRTNYDRAIDLLSEARARIGGTDAIPGLLWWYGVACMRQGDVDGAEMTFHNYAAAHPYRVLPFLLRADFFETHGLDAEQVDRDIGVVLSLQPPPDTLAAAWHVRARLRQDQGRIADARKAIDRAIALQPEKALYRRFRAELDAE